MALTSNKNSTGTRGENGTDNSLQIEESQWTEYHKGVATYRPGKDSCPTPLEERPFVAWDGEGISTDADAPQNYVLLAAYTPDGPRYIKGERLRTTDILNFLIDVERDYPDAYHVGFGLGYDINQFVATLTHTQLSILHKTGVLYLNLRMFRLQWLKGKSLTITRYRRQRDSNGTIKQVKDTSMILYDVWSFFHTSFVKSCEKFLGDSEELAIVRKGKDRRAVFTYDQLETEILPYCILEVKLLVQLMEEFRRVVFAAGFRIRMWHGPGAIASYVLRDKGIKEHMAETPPEVREAARYAYAAGRFELPKVGRFGKVYAVDQNSAYPYAIAQLPSLANGTWRRVVGKPSRLARFGVYRVQSGAQFSMLLSRDLAPLFHRDRVGRISYPWINDGWYWSPEVSLIFNDSRYSIIEGWEFLPNDSSERPFHWVSEMFDQRLQLQAEGNSAEYALKIALNSLYGKMAQRVGWDKENQKPPRWHQLEWAGWVTSYTRACIYRMCQRVGLDSVVAIETDGVYTTTDPRSVGVKHDIQLGEWKISEHPEVFYVQSGLAWLRKDDDWQIKYRGLDPSSISLTTVISHLSSLTSVESWKVPIEGTAHRFVGVGAALVSRNWQQRFCRWETVPRRITVGGDGKRIHAIARCRACAEGITPDKVAHDLVTNVPRSGISKPHYLPWVAGTEAPGWIAVADLERELIPDV